MCCMLAHGGGAAATSKSASFVAGELKRCPLWTQVPEYDAETRRRITDVYVALAHFDSATIRAGVASYVNSYVSAGRPELGYVDASQKVYAFLRVVFKVPARIDASKGSPYGLMGNPVYPDGVDMLWPFSMDSAGRLALTGVDSGLHTGVPYDPLSDFDKMASHLERRFPVSRAVDRTTMSFRQ